MGIRSVFIWIGIIALLGIYSCADDTKEVDDDSGEYVNNTERVISKKSVQSENSEKVKSGVIAKDSVVDNTIDSSSISLKKEISKEKKTEDNVEDSKQLTKKPIQEKVIIEKEKVVDASSTVQTGETKEKEPAKVEEVYVSDELDLSVDRNQQYNPDNANAILDLEKGSNITIIPIFTEKDLGMYYVQFKESARKLNKAELASLLNQECKVYIVNHQGLYKYSVFQSDNEISAQAAKKIFDGNCGNHKSVVTTYKSDW